MKMKPLLSICIAAYNVEPFIAECLNSVFNQDYDDFEVCLVDNGSDDKTVEICEVFANRFPDKIRFVKLLPPTVIGRSSLTAARMCNGEYLVALDSDDYLKPGALKKIAEVAVTKKPDIIMYNYDCLISEGNKTNFRMDFDETKINEVPFLEAIKYITGYKTFQSFMWMYASRLDERTKTAINGQSSGGGIHADASILVSFFLRYRSIYYIDENLYVYRLRSNSMTATIKSSEGSKGLYLSFIDLVKFVNGRDLGQGSRYTIEENLSVAAPNLMKYFKLAISETRFLRKDDYLDICSSIDSIRNDFKILERLNDALLTNFLESITQYGAEVGLQRLLDFDEKSLVDQVEPFRNALIYAMPTGAYSEHTVETLKRYGIKIEKFLDNADQKHNTWIQDILCQKPENGIDTDNIDDVYIVISSVYPAHIQEMKMQLLYLGIKESNMIIRGDYKNE